MFPELTISHVVVSMCQTQSIHLGLVLFGDLNEWDGKVGGKSKREGVYDG